MTQLKIGDISTDFCYWPNSADSPAQSTRENSPWSSGLTFSRQTSFRTFCISEHGFQAALKSLNIDYCPTMSQFSDIYLTFSQNKFWNFCEIDQKKRKCFFQFFPRGWFCQNFFSKNTFGPCTSSPGCFSHGLLYFHDFLPFSRVLELRSRVSSRKNDFFSLS